MNKQQLLDMFGWGIGLWLFGYVLGIVLFMVVPPTLIGWVLTPIGVAVTLWVLNKKIASKNFGYYLYLGFAWTAVAVVFVFLFLVMVFKPADGYYKLDVYLYYLLTFVLPVVAGWYKTRRGTK
jgi:hypothetical protein